MVIFMEQMKKCSSGTNTGRKPKPKRIRGGSDDALYKSTFTSLLTHLNQT